MTVGELENKLTTSEFFKWVEYFNHNAPKEDGPVNLLEDPDALLKGFGL